MHLCAIFTFFGFLFFCFFFNDTATTEIYTLSLHDALPISMIWGVGAVTRESLEKAGIRTFSDLLRWDRKELGAKFGSMGDRLWHLARGQDKRDRKSTRLNSSH